MQKREGYFKDTPFPCLLFSIWKSAKSGCLEVNKDKRVKKIFFRKGDIVIEKGTFQEKTFPAKLIEKKVLNQDSLKKGKDFSKKKQHHTNKSSW